MDKNIKREIEEAFERFARQIEIVEEAFEKMNVQLDRLKNDADKIKTGSSLDGEIDRNDRI